METEQMISISEFCIHHEVEIAFIHSLHEFGLVDIITIEEKQYIFQGQISELEKMIRLHYELDINLEGIDAIAHLLKKVDTLNEELNAMKNKLSLYEED